MPVPLQKILKYITISLIFINNTLLFIMKKSNIKLLSMLFAACTLSATMVSCGDDDNKTNPEQNVNNNGGSTVEDRTTSSVQRFTAWAEVSFSYVQTPMYDDSVSIEIKTTNTNGVETGTLTFTSATWGKGTFDLTTKTGKLEVSHHGSTNTYDATLSGTYKEDNLVITLPSLMNGTTIKIHMGGIPYTIEISHSYDVNTYANCKYFKNYQPTEGETAVVAANTEDDYETVNISYTSTTWGTCTFTSVTVTPTNKAGVDEYKISGSGVCLMPGMNGGEAKEYAAEIDGTIINDEFVATIQIPSVMGGTTIYLNPEDFEEVKNSASDDKE